MKLIQEDRILWLDILCFSSMWCLLRYRGKVDRVVYLNMHKFIGPFINVFSSKILKIPVVQVGDIVRFEIKHEGAYVYTSSSTISIVSSDFIVSNLLGGLYFLIGL